VLVIDGKNNNDDDMFTGKNNNNDGILASNDDKQERNNDSIGNDETMRNCCLQAQEDEHRAQSWSFQIARGYHEGRKEHAQDSLESVSLQKESKLRRNSAELHAEHKCAPGLRLTSLPKLRRDSIFRNMQMSPKVIRTRRRIKGRGL
jgi:hypothetical protein